MTVRYITGDATYPEQIGSDPLASRVIAHVCNDKGKWGRGFTQALDRRWRRAGQFFLDQKSRDLGDVQYVAIGDGLTVANMVAQHGVRSASNPHPLNYGALARCLNDVALYAKQQGATIHMPRIGCGLAGGRWDRVLELIEDQMRDLYVLVYDLPTEDA